jgi:hypothetical protein
MAEAVSTAVEDFMAGVASTVAAGFAAGAASEAEWDSATAAGFVAARSALDFAEGQDFAVERSAAAFAETVFAAAGAGADAVGVGVGEAGAGRIGVGPDTLIHIGTTRGGRRLITRPAIIPTTILTTTLHPPIHRLAARIEIIHTGTTRT